MRRRFRFDPAFALAVCYLLVGERSVWGLLSLAAALLHELGHLGAAAMVGIQPAEITVGALGARMGFSVPLLSYRHELLIAAAGPGVNLLCIPPCLWGIRRLGGLDGAGEYLLFFAAASLALAVINLLPLRTFDGGRILGALCALWFGDRIARRMLDISTVLCSILLWGCGAALWFSAWKNLSLLVLSTALLVRTVQDSLTC